MNTCDLVFLLYESKSSICLKFLQHKGHTCAFSAFPGPVTASTQQVHKDASILVQVLRNSSGVGHPRATRKGPEGRALTPGAVAVGIHEGEAQPLVLLQGALVREAPVHSAHQCLLLAVVDGCLGHVHRLPVEEG